MGGNKIHFSIFAQNGGKAMLMQSADFPQIWKAGRYKLRLQSVSVATDEYSNVFTIQSVYKLPRFASKSHLITYIHRFCPQFSSVFWNDAWCKTIVVTQQVITNGGKIMYTEGSV